MIARVILITMPIEAAIRLLSQVVPLEEKAEILESYERRRFLSNRIK